FNRALSPVIAQAASWEEKASFAWPDERAAHRAPRPAGGGADGSAHVRSSAGERGHGFDPQADESQERDALRDFERCLRLSGSKLLERGDFLEALHDQH